MLNCAVPSHQEELQQRIVEEQQNNNLSVEILNGNAESLTGLVGSAQALKEPGIDRLLAAGWKSCRRLPHRNKRSRFLLSVSDVAGAQSA